jgi:hypothetical protein
MNALRSVEVPADVLRDLRAFLGQSGKQLTVYEAIRAAVKSWIAEQADDAQLAASHLSGYQWKELFLPNGTEVRANYDTQSHYAMVDNDLLCYQGQPMSPRQFTMAVAGEGRNAWRDLWVRLPGERQWRRAADLRRALRQQAALPPSPQEAVSAAAASLKSALRCALELIDKTSASPPAVARGRHYERRGVDHSDVPFDGP